METTKPVLDFYSKNPNFHEIDGNKKLMKLQGKLTLLSMFKTLTLEELLI